MLALALKRAAVIASIRISADFATSTIPACPAIGTLTEKLQPTSVQMGALSRYRMEGLAVMNAAMVIGAMIERTEAEKIARIAWAVT